MLLMIICYDFPQGTSVLQVTAQDGDRGISNEVQYSIVEGKYIRLLCIDIKTSFTDIHV